MASDGSGVGPRIGLFLGLSALCGVLVAGLALPAVGIAGLTAKRAAESFQALPGALQTQPLAQRSRLLAADGTVIATFYRENRVYVPLDKVAPVMQDAVIAIEDARFYEHNGVDVRGTLRALVANTQAGDITQGGSTITQQYVKNVLQATARTKKERSAASAQTLSRKIRELRYALGVEQERSKDEILEGYLNIAYFGAGAYGVEAAARRYFSKPASDLRLHEAATIAGIVQFPSLYDPLQNPQASRDRRDQVLRRMADLGMVTREQAERAQSRPLRKTLKPSSAPNGCATSKAPFFCDYVVERLLGDATFGKNRAARKALLNRGGLTIRTTLDMQAQRSAQDAVNSTIPPTDPSQKVAAIAMVQPGTGNIVAMAQNRGYGSGKGNTFVNNVVDRKYNGTNGVQAGSTFKIFTLAAAIEKGIPLSTSIYSPLRKTYPPGTFTNCQGSSVAEAWPVGNSTTRSGGTFDLRSGTEQSVNTFFSELELRVGLCATVDMAERTGMHTALGDPPGMNPSFTLGTDAISPLSLANSYATFAARGEYCEPRVITAVRQLEGDRIAIPPPLCKQVMEPEIADAVNDVLVGVIDGPNSARTGATMSLGRPAAGKTGTTDGNAAVWFAGHTPDLAAAVWSGDPRGGVDYPMRNVTINGTFYPVVYGSLVPGPIWRQAMLGALKDVPPSDFVPIDPTKIAGEAGTVPFVAGLSRKDATKRLEKAGFVVTLAPDAVTSYQPEGTAAYTSPGAGSSVTTGTTVTLYLSSGVAPAPAPSATSDGGGGGGDGGGDGGNTGGGGGGNTGGGGGGNNKPDKPGNSGNSGNNGNGNGNN